MSQLDKNAVVAAFTEAYTKTHGKAPDLEIKSGWYKVDGGKGIRLAALQELTDSMVNAVEVSDESQAVAEAEAVVDVEAVVAVEEKMTSNDQAQEPIETEVIPPTQPVVEPAVKASDIVVEQSPQVEKKRFSIKAMWQEIVKKVTG